VAELEDLGTPPVFAEIVRVGYAVARMRLSTDITVPREVAAMAEKVDRATMALQDAVDLAAELQCEGARQPVSVIPPPGAALDQERALIWFRHAELQATVEEFVGTGVGLPPPIGRATEYEAVRAQATRALTGLEAQRRAALQAAGPQPPHPPKAGPAPLGLAGRTAPETELVRSPDTGASPGDGDSPPAASASATTSRGGKVTRASTTASLASSPTLDALERRLESLRSPCGPSCRSHPDIDVGFEHPVVEVSRPARGER